LLNITCYKLSQIDTAPTDPGIYAWYGELSIGARDWRDDIKADIDEGEKNFRNLISRHTTRYCSVPLDVKAKSNFECEWQGILTDNGGMNLIKVLNAESVETRDFENKIKKCISNVTTRELLSKIFTSTTPHFSAPIYIGKAKNLNNRLNAHKSHFLSLSQQLLENPSIMDNLPLDDQFASRAVKLGFKESNLKVYAINLLPFIEAGISLEEVVEIAETAEFLLNSDFRIVVPCNNEAIPK
jgi:hypothetical protein